MAQIAERSIIAIFKGFSHLLCPYLTVTYTSFLLKHERVPKQYIRYDKLLGTLWERHHFYAVIINKKDGHLVTFDGLNHSQYKDHNINSTYRKIARIFQIPKIFNVVLKKAQDPSCNLCLPLVATFFLHYFNYRFTLDMTYHLIKTRTPVQCIRKAKQKAKTICKKRTFVIPPPLSKSQTLVNYC